MTTDNFTEAAAEEANARYGTAGNREVWMEAAEWARDHLAEQEPTLAEVTAAIHAYDSVVEGLGGDYAPGTAIRAALFAARKARP